MSHLPGHLALLSVVAFLWGCGPAGSATDAHAAHAESATADATSAAPHADHPAAPTTDAGPSRTTERSVYQLPGTWRDQAGRELTLDELAGRPQVLAFVYTSCAFACPRIVAQMKRIEAQAASDAGFVLVSIDPERDTPERLARFAESSGLSSERWTLLNGDDGRILELSVLLDVKYRATGDGEFAHSNVLILLDAEGVPVERVEGLEADLTPLVQALDG